MVSGLGPGVGLDRLLQGSQGMQVNRMLDALGLPGSVGDMIGAQIDAARGDWAGYARNMMDMTGGLGTQAMDKLFGKGLPGSQFVPRPHRMLGRGRKLWGKQFHTPFGTHDISRERLGGRGLFGRIAGRSLEKAILTNPAFKARMERILGGRIIPDGRADGKITVHRFRPNFSQVPFSNNIANNPMLSGVYNSLARVEGNANNLAATQTNAAANKAGGSASSALKDPEMGKWAGEMGMTPPMSFEDILFLLMLKYAKKKEKEILDMAKQLTRQGGGEGDKAGGAEGAAKAGGGGRRRRGYGGGLLGGIGKIAGGMLGGMAGPLGGMIGSQLGGALGNMIGGGGGGGAGGGLGGMLGGGGGAGGAKGGGGAGGAQGGGGPFDANQSDTEKQAMLQKLMNDLQKVYQLLTNTVKSLHDMQMASIRNIR